MYRIEKTVAFEDWLDGLRDRMARKRILMRVARVEAGLLGDWKTLGDGVSELRIDYGPGYRIYYTIRKNVIVILLCGSDKRDQDRAIKLAKSLAEKI
jgi:putative addiction module killer protein